MMQELHKSCLPKMVSPQKIVTPILKKKEFSSRHYIGNLRSPDRDIVHWIAPDNGYSVTWVNLTLSPDFNCALISDGV